MVGVYQIARLTNPDIDLRPYLEGALRQGGVRSRSEAGPLQTIFLGLLLLAVFSMRMGLFPLMFLGGMGGYGARRGLGGYAGGGGGFGGFSGGGGGFSGGGASGGW